MEKFLIKLLSSSRDLDGKIYVQFVPDNEYELIIKKNDFTDAEQINDYGYLESVKVELFEGLADAFGDEFTNKYEL